VPNEPNPLSDRLHIEQLEISARIGVPEKERATPQRLNRQHLFLAILRAARYGRPDRQHGQLLDRR
jgi:hypothetical protein